MNRISQLVKNPRIPKKKKRKKMALKVNYDSLHRTYSSANNPQKRGTCKWIKIIKPKKPNSANRACARLALSNGEEVTIYIPGEGHNLQEYSTVLINGRRLQDVPGVKYRVVRGWEYGDIKGVEGRRQGRSLYGSKLEKSATLKR